MRLCFIEGVTSSDIIILPPIGTPYLVNRSGQSEIIPNEYLLYISQHKGKTESPKTWRTYSYHLYSFFAWLEANNLHWNQKQVVGRPSVIAIYRNWAKSKRERSTVNDYLGTIIRFYQWAFHKKIISDVPWDIEEVLVPRRTDVFAHTSSSCRKKTVDVKLREVEKPIRFLTIDECKSLLDTLTNPTHRLMTQLTLATGIRSSELISFPEEYIFNPSSHEEDVSKNQSHFRIYLDPDKLDIKYNKPRSIYIKRTLMHSLWEYAMLVRPLRERQTKGISNELFLTSKGLQFHEKSYNSILYKAGKKIGKHITPHMLRHTFATHTLFSLSDTHNSTFALKWVKDRLGHSSVETTMRYLHLLGELHVNELDRYQQELDIPLGEEMNHAS